MVVAFWYARRPPRSTQPGGYPSHNESITGPESAHNQGGGLTTMPAGFVWFPRGEPTQRDSRAVGPKGLGGSP